MEKDKYEIHLNVYQDRSELHMPDKTTVFYEGVQSSAATQRYEIIRKALEGGFYEETLQNIPQVVASSTMSDAQIKTIRDLVDGLTSETGRALVGLTCLQLAVKSIDASQSVRLHKASRRRGFSWQEGISMRTLDNSFNTPFLRRAGLLNINRDGIMMTRSLAENYPYSRLYKAEMRGPFEQWVEIVEAVESGKLTPYPALCLLLSLLENRSVAFAAKADSAAALAKAKDGASLAEISELLFRFFSGATYSARAFEVVLHCLIQALAEMGLVEGTLKPLSQMRSANKKHGNIGDIELMQGGTIIESWDAKYGKPYLRDELEELNDKLQAHPSAEIVGFVVNSAIDKSDDVVARAEEIALVHDCEVLLLSFSEWLDLKTAALNAAQEKELAARWLVAVAESFGQKRLRLAPIDEPCDEWIDSLTTLLK